MLQTVPSEISSINPYHLNGHKTASDVSQELVIAFGLTWTLKFSDIWTTWSYVSLILDAIAKLLALHFSTCQVVSAPGAYVQIVNQPPGSA